MRCAVLHYIIRQKVAFDNIELKYVSKKENTMNNARDKYDFAYAVALVWWSIFTSSKKNRNNTPLPRGR